LSQNVCLLKWLVLKVNSNEMNKDVIYIDTDDDVTAIIGKIKDSKEKIIALVPPKRIGVLQSSVNLRLLVKMAASSHKRLVLVTNNKALINLSAVAKIPVARSLQSKPALAEIDALEIDDGEDIIDGETLPVGDLIKTADEPMDIEIDVPKKESVSDIIDEINVEKESTMPVVKDDKDTFSIPGKKMKVPDFTKFRKLLFLGIFALIGVGAFLYWAIVFAPAADIIITASTENESASMTVKLGTETDIEKNTIKIISKEIKKDLSVNFEATGQKNTGNRASGIITVENCDNNRSFTINSGTIFTTNSGLTYASDSSALVPGFSGSASQCRADGTGAGTVDIAVTATDPGENFNVNSTNYKISGISGDVYAYGDKMTGGTTEMSAVVTKSDVEKATEALKALSTDSVKQQLIKEFEEDELVLSDSYAVSYGEFISTPAIDEQVTDTSVLTTSTTFVMTAIPETEVEVYLNNVFDEKINKETEKVYDNGIKEVKISGYLSNEEGVTVRITASGEIGPNLDENIIIELVKGKKFGEAQSLMLNVPGVSDFEINFSYFWVKTIPKDVEKIDVQFIIDDAKDS
jgi:hypothetical protein